MLALMSRHKNSETAIARSSYNFIGPLSSLTIWKHKFEIYGPEGNPENSPMLWKRLFHRRILALAIAKVLEDKFPNRNNVAVNTKTSHDIVNLVDANLSSYYDSQVGWTEWQYCTVDERGRDKNNIRTRDRLEGRKTVQGQDLRIVLSPIYRKSLDVFVQRCIAGPDIDFRVPKPTIFDLPGNMGQQLNPWITSGPMDKPTSKSSSGWYPIHLRNEVSVRVSEESRYLHLEYDAVTMVKRTQISAKSSGIGLTISSRKIMSKSTSKPYARHSLASGSSVRTATVPARRSPRPNGPLCFKCTMSNSATQT
jgi:hypothetical protein